MENLPILEYKPVPDGSYVEGVLVRKPNSFGDIMELAINGKIKPKKLIIGGIIFVPDETFEYLQEGGYFEDSNIFKIANKLIRGKDAVIIHSSIGAMITNPEGYDYGRYIGVFKQN